MYGFYQCLSSTDSPGHLTRPENKYQDSIYTGNQNVPHTVATSGIGTGRNNIHIPLPLPLPYFFHKQNNCKFFPVAQILVPSLTCTFPAGVLKDDNSGEWCTGAKVPHATLSLSSSGRHSTCSSPFKPDQKFLS